MSRVRALGCVQPLKYGPPLIVPALEPLDHPSVALEGVLRQNQIARGWDSARVDKDFVMMAQDGQHRLAVDPHSLPAPKRPQQPVTEPSLRRTSWRCTR